MKSEWNKSRKIRYAIVGSVLTLIIATLLYYYIKYEPTWEEIKSSIENAPAWIFIIALIFLPPIGTPLSIFLIAIGARFGLIEALLVSTLGIALHHVIALAISQLITGEKEPSESQQKIWKKLEEKSGGNASKLLLLWGLLPGLPYIVKLYLPISMGVSSRPYLQWNTLGHLLGAYLFVSLGNALFDGKNLVVFITLFVVIGVGIGLKILKSRVTQNA